MTQGTRLHGILSKCPRLAGRTITYIALLSIFAVSLSSGHRSKMYEKSQRVSEMSITLGEYWERSIDKRTMIFYFSGHGYLSDVDFNSYRKELDTSDDLIAKSMVDSLRSLGFSDVKVERLLITEKWINTSQANRSPDRKSLIFLLNRMELEALYYDSRISFADYTIALANLRKETDGFAKSNVSGISVRPDQGDLETLRKEIADLKAEVQKLPHTQSIHYPPEFWIAFAVAICSWLGMLTTFIFAFRNDRRQKRELEGLKATQEQYLNLQKHQLETKLQVDEGSIIVVTRDFDIKKALDIGDLSRKLKS